MKKKGGGRVFVLKVNFFGCFYKKNLINMYVFHNPTQKPQIRDHFLMCFVLFVVIIVPTILLIRVILIREYSYHTHT